MSSNNEAKHKKTIEERYTKLTQLEHILSRPDSYVGSVNDENIVAWVWDGEAKAMKNKSITYVPAMFKIFDEIIVNAADVKAREIFESDSYTHTTTQRMIKLSITIDRNENMIKVCNDGAGIPIEIHKKYNVYVPELIFGQLLTSDNYDDNELRFTGGRNGYGAKLTNIFSEKFTVKVIDAVRKKKFVMTWKNNMQNKSEPVIESINSRTNLVEITFYPDFKRLNMPNKLNDDIYSLLVKRVYDMAGTVGVKVELNDSIIPINNFKEYVDLYYNGLQTDFNPNKKLQKISNGEKSTINNDASTSSEVTISTVTKIYECISPQWEIVIGMSDGQFQQVSFVNNICTSKGGTHVNYILEPIIQAVIKKISAKNKGGMEVKAHQVKNHMFVFINCRIGNPTFDSQTKEYMTLNLTSLKPKVTVSEKLINAVMKSPIIESILFWLQSKQQLELQRKMKGVGRVGGRERIVGVPKLEDANDAGTKFSYDCTLILTEGESAKTSCIAGLSVVGRDRYGVFPLRGKILNVREASFKQLSENKELQSILKITGLEIGKQISDPRSLRYGSIMIMTDQDHDGSHIKGLIINLLHYFWPELLRYPGFLKEFVTPIIKARSRKGKEILSFFTLTQFKQWKDQMPNEELTKKYDIKYYKGLGTSGPKEFQDYFRAMDHHQLEFVFNNDEDFEAIDMAFNGKRAEDRKTWISSFQEGTFLDHEIRKVTYKDFINKELVLFSRYDLERSIPSLIDGLKPVQRKVLYSAFKRQLFKTEMKVEQFAAYVSNVTSYHHGTVSIEQTIINMAQQFVGSNNFSLLEPCGQFGSRKEGGKDASAARYIFTKLTNICRKLFRQEDEPLYTYYVEEGEVIEPKHYVPIIPQILINGCEGIGTGWSSSIPNFNPKHIIANVRRFMKNEELVKMEPWYRGHTGKIISNNKQGYDSCGIIEQIDENTIYISELPIKVWTQSYKEFLEELLQSGIETASKNQNVKKSTDKNQKNKNFNNLQPKNYGFTITDYRDNSTHENVAFTITVTKEQMNAILHIGLEKAFKLRKSLSLSNMTAFTTEGKVYRFESEIDILLEFCKIRLQYYQNRKDNIILSLKKSLAYIDNKLRFINMVLSNELTINNKKYKTLIGELEEKGFEKSSAIDKKFIYKKSEAELIDKDEILGQEISEDILNNNPVSGDDQEDSNYNNSDYKYLLSMPLYSLTYEKVNDLTRQAEQKQTELTLIQQTTINDLWERDLIELEKVIQDFEDTMYKNQLEAEEARAKISSSTNPFNRKAKGAKRVRKNKSNGNDSVNKNKSITADTIKESAKELLVDKPIDNLFSSMNSEFTQIPRTKKSNRKTYKYSDEDSYEQTSQYESDI